MAATGTSLGVGDVAARIARRPVTVVLTVIVVTVLAVSAALLRPADYSATAVVTVAPITAEQFDSTPISQQVNIITEREVVTSREVAVRAAEATGNRIDAGELLRSVEVTAPAGSQVMSITMSLPDAELAALGANELARAYLDVRADAADTVAQRLIDNFQARIDELSASLADEDEPANIASVEQQLVSLRDQQSRLATVAVNPGRIVGEAQPPSAPSSPGVAVLAIAGLMLGSLLACGVALVVDRLDPKVRTLARLEEAAPGVAALARYDAQDPSEPFRRAMLLLRRSSVWSSSPEGTSEPVVVVLVADHPRTRHKTANALWATATDMGLVVELVESEDVDAGRVDRGWPDEAAKRAWRGSDAVVIDAAGVVSVARQQALAERADQLVMLVSRRTKLSKLRTLEEAFTEAGTSVDLVFFISRRWERRGLRVGT